MTRARITWKVALTSVAAGLLTLAPISSPAQAEPSRRVWAAPDSDSAGHEQVRSLAAAIGTDRIRIEPSASHLARLRMLRDGRAHFAATSIAGSFFAQEGLFAYAGKDWGPQPVRLVLTNVPAQLFGIVAAGDAAIASIADLRGKRIAEVGEAPEFAQHLSGLLASAGLGWSDVTVVKVSGYRAAIDAIVANRADAAFATSLSPDLQSLTKSPRGIAWPVLPHADRVGWDRLLQIAPYFLPVDATEGAGLSAKAPVESVNWPYPLLITLGRRSTDDVYETARSLITRFRSYRDQAPGNIGWEAKRQPLAWALPWHEGAIKALREQGVWNDSHQAHNDLLLRRQQVLRRAWDTLRRDALTQPEDEQPDEAAWLRARAAALKEAGLAVYPPGKTEY